MKHFLENTVVYLVGLLQETSTFRGVLGGIVLFGGLAISPERLDAICFFALALSTFLKAVLPDKWWE